MKIDLLDGSIRFERGTVSHADDRAKFLASPLGHKPRRERLVSKEWWHITVDPEPGVASTILFKGDRLDRVFVLLEVPSDKQGEWTVEHELERKALHDQWLFRTLGAPPYEYSWGSISSWFDAKGCVSEIIVSYAN